MLDKPYRILIIDDDEAMCELLEDTIHTTHPEQFKTITRTNGEHLASILTDENIHIVITDLNMPGQCGYDVCRIVTEQFKSVQVLLLTGDISFSVATTCFRDGIAALLNKPLNPAKLSAALKIATDRLDYWREVLLVYMK